MHLSTTVAVVVLPVAVHWMVMVFPQYGLVFDREPIRAYGRATTLSTVPSEVEPHAPRPAVYQVMSPSHGLLDEHTSVEEPAEEEELETAAGAAAVVLPAGGAYAGAT
jgi:hypothetical protein